MALQIASTITLPTKASSQVHGDQKLPMPRSNAMLPKKPPTSAPTTPSSSVCTQLPLFLFSAALASAPMMSPIKIQPMIPMPPKYGSGPAILRTGGATCRTTYASGVSAVTILSPMHLVFQLLTLVHLIGFAALFGGCLVQTRTMEPEVNLTMLVGAWIQLISGLALGALLELAPDPTDPVNHAKLGTKLAVAAVVLLLVAKNRKFASIPRGLWALITALTLGNAAIAVLWS